MTGGLIEQMWAPTLHQLAEVLDVEIDELEVVYETDGLDHDVQTGFGTVEAGTASVVRFELRALAAGMPWATMASTAAAVSGFGSRRCCTCRGPSAPW